MADPVGRAVDIELPGYGPIPESRVTAQIIGEIRSERTSGLHVPLEHTDARTEGSGLLVCDFKLANQQT